MTRPFELDPPELVSRLEEMVDITFADLTSEFLLMPKGSGFIEYYDFSAAYEVLKRHTGGFSEFTEARIFDALLNDSRAFCVLRAILGFTPPEWAELARAEGFPDVTQGAARSLDRTCRGDPQFFSRLEKRLRARQTGTFEPGAPETPKSYERISLLVRVAVQQLTASQPKESESLLHRLDKFDTADGLASLQYAARENVPYAVLLYERYLGRPFAGHRDAVSELIAEIMENAVEAKLREAGVSYRKTQRAERIPGFGQAPDFCIPDERAPAVVIEAKITSDDGTARDKVARIKELETQRNRHVQEGRPAYEVVACIDGRGFRQRREDMRQLLLRLGGKVFTGASLDALVNQTRIREFVTKTP
jgi:hypothetical protein